MSSLPGGDGQPSLFQVREPRRRFLGPFILVMVLHAGLAVWTSRPSRVQTRPAAEAARVVFRLPVRKVAVDEPPGGGPKRPPPLARRHQIRLPLRPPREIPPPVLETPPPAPPDPPELAEAEESLDEDAGGAAGEGTGQGGGGGVGTGSGSGTGPGQGSVTSKARKAWLSHTDWRCSRPGNEELGRVVVRLRVEVQPDGRPGQVTVLGPGPEVFNRRAMDCARDETYLPALDPDGRPIAGACEFGIEFLN